MSHLAKAAALSAASRAAVSWTAISLSTLLACSGSKPAEAPAAAPSAEAAALPLTPAQATDPAPEAAPSLEPPVDATPAEQTLFVADARVDCRGEALQKCLQVRASEAEPYRNLYVGIEGFDYEPSYTYELRVEVVPVPNAPADGSALSYRLIEVVSKRKLPASKSN